jgi:pantothenate synthetase
MKLSECSVFSPYVQKGLCRKTRYTNERNEVIEIDYDDLETMKELGTGQYGIVFKSRHKKSNLIVAVKVNAVCFQNYLDLNVFNYKAY